MTQRVGIFGLPDDPQVAAVARMAERLGATTVTMRLDAAECSGWRWRPDRIERADGEVLDELTSVYVRGVPAAIPRHHEAVVSAEDEAAWRERFERAGRMHGVARAAQHWLERRGVAMVNPVASFWFHRSKPAADDRLAAAGLPVPAGLVTTDADEVRRFVDEVGEVVYKPVGGGGACRALDVGQLDSPELCARLGRAPTLFQQRVRGRDVRVYVLDGTTVAACVIHTDAVDYRGHETGVETIVTSPELRTLAARAAEELGMVFAGIDLKEADDGALTLLDVNPSPMFTGIERLSGVDVAGPLAERLVRGGPRCVS